MKKLYVMVILLSLTSLFPGCAGLTPRPDIDTRLRPEEPVRFFETLTAAIHNSGVSDSVSAIIPGFPYLAVNRFLHALAKRELDDHEFAEWLSLAKNEAFLTHDKEIRNLPEPAVQRLTVEFGLPSTRSALLAKTSTYGEELYKKDHTDPNFRGAVLSAVYLPDVYSRTMRIFGIYPIAALPVAYLTHRAQDKFKKWFDAPPESLPVLGSLTTFKPKTSVNIPVERLRELFKKTPENHLKMKVFSPDITRNLAEILAPTLLQDVSGPHDIPGKVEWVNGKVNINSAQPTLYYYLTYALVKGKPITQINYAAWFTERLGPLAPAIERGALDGLTIRISMDSEGNPLMLDIMNSCGCYHMFIPQKGLVAETKDKPFSVDAFLPQSLPDDFPESSLLIRVNSGWHQVQQVSASREPVKAENVYQLSPYAELESLPHEDGRYESIFTPDGIMKGSYRIEPFLLFSMGVPSVGFMRQRAHHAISLVGWDYFDAPDLFERSLILK